MSSITTDLAAMLSTVRRPGDFFVSGTTELLAPLLEIDGVGPIALALLPVQAGQLVAVARRAPYGRGAETLVETAVRRTWQIGADRVHIRGKHWERTLETILARVADGLGVSEPVAAELYKLLVYDRGSFFISHHTEKAPGMFATLVIVLPSISAGGELIVHHKGREARLDLRCPEPSEAAFASFYADCIHEVLPVTEGCRLILIYNLVRRRRGALPEPPDYHGEENRIAALLQSWRASKMSPDDDAPEKLIYLLEHAYTPAELGFATLKGPDAAAAAVLAAAARQSDTELHLALLTVEESGIAEYTGYGSRRGRWSEPELEAGEVDDRSVGLSEWRRLDGSPSLLVELPVEDEELSPPDTLEDMDPDDEDFRRPATKEPSSSAPTGGPLSCLAAQSILRGPQPGRSAGHPAVSRRPDRALGGKWSGPTIPSVGSCARPFRAHGIQMADARLVSRPRRDAERSRPHADLADPARGFAADRRATGEDRRAWWLR